MKDNFQDKWVWKSDKGNIYIHCDDILEIAQALQQYKSNLLEGLR